MTDERQTDHTHQLLKRLGQSKELLLGLICLVIGSGSVAVNLSQGDTGGLTIGIMLLVLALFWLNGGLMGHGSL